LRCGDAGEARKRACLALARIEQALAQASNGIKLPDEARDACVKRDLVA